MQPRGKARFLSTLRTDRVGLASADRLLLSPLVFESILLDRQIHVPTGFVTDFASVPRAPLTYWLFGGVGDEAAVVHDFLYEKALVTRDLADLVYGEALEACGVARWRRAAMVLAVQLFGGSRYGANVAAAP
ncbi:DUF1353 domain-containing protein [Massilia sp. NP310]|uniref:DUF1353 domain-containing protein n=1 Tax=Massilia sp. NP310 TaxID=2861282 RepID=UPI001C63817A|nr:DUF1353 domain-containing protein [Massilia sp. NP310]QYG03900.1 DUF1353 domain-containing protein [Massilia sp. NP310]